MKRITLHIICFLLIVAAMPLYGQTFEVVSKEFVGSSYFGALRGVIVDAKNTPVEGALVAFEDSELKTTTNSKGEFNFEQVVPGSYKVVVSFADLKSVSRKLSFSSSKKLYCEIKLPLNKEAYSFVKGEKIDITSLSIAKRDSSSTEQLNRVDSEILDLHNGADLSDVVTLLPGVSIKRKANGEDALQINGANQSLTSLTINGVSFAGGDGASGYNWLKILPISMLKSVEVVANSSYDMEGDAAGGVVNVVTLGVSKENVIEGAFSALYNPIFNKFGYNGSVNYGGRAANNKFGYMVAISLLSNSGGADKIDAEWELDSKSVPYLSNMRQQQLYFDENRYNLYLSSDYIINKNHKLALNGYFNRSDRYETGYNLTYGSLTALDNQNNTTSIISKESQAGVGDKYLGNLNIVQNMGINLGANHTFSLLHLDWKIGYTHSKRVSPNERNFSISTPLSSPLNVEILYDKDNLALISPLDESKSEFTAQNFSYLNSLAEITTTQSERDWFGAFNFEYDFSKGERASVMKFGYEVKDKRAEKNVDYRNYSPKDGDFIENSIANSSSQSRENYSIGGYQIGNFVSSDDIAAMRLNDKNSFDFSENELENAKSYSVREFINAFYVGLEQRLAKQCIASVGVRFENDYRNFSGYNYVFNKESETVGVEQKKSSGADVSFLPSLEVIYTPNSKFKVVGGYYTSVIRPKFSQMAPAAIIDTLGNLVDVDKYALRDGISRTLNLEAQYSGNYSIFRGSIFYKSLDNFIVNFYSPIYNNWTDNYHAVNGGDAVVSGAQVAMQCNLAPLSQLLKGLIFSANYTFSHSYVSDPNSLIFQGVNEDYISLPATPRHLFHTSLLYKSRVVSAQISYNFSSSYLNNIEVGIGSFYNRYSAPFHNLGANVVINLNRYIALFINANNILNQPQCIYQDSKNRVASLEYLGTEIRGGVKINLSKK